MTFNTMLICLWVVLLHFHLNLLCQHLPLCRHTRTYAPSCANDYLYRLNIKIPFDSFLSNLHRSPTTVHASSMHLVGAPCFSQNRRATHQCMGGTSVQYTESSETHTDLPKRWISPNTPEISELSSPVPSGLQCGADGTATKIRATASFSWFLMLLPSLQGPTTKDLVGFDGYQLC